MPDLVEFLRARLDERAAAAQAALDFPYEIPQDAPWWAARQRVKQGDPSTGYSSTWDQHVALNDPATVLAKVEVERKLIELHGPAVLRAGGGAQYYDAQTVCRSCEPNRQFPEESFPCATLRLLALPYAAHPSYREEWKP